MYIYTGIYRYLLQKITIIIVIIIIIIVTIWFLRLYGRMEDTVLSFLELSMLFDLHCSAEAIEDFFRSVKILRSSKSPNWVSGRKMRNSSKRAKGFKGFMRREYGYTERHGFTGRDKVST
jgi:hypothetical protein